MKLKTCKIISFSILGAALILAVIAEAIQSTLLFGICITLCVIDIVILFFFCRCPHCDMPIRFSGEYCPFCGEKLKK